jgi:hypothetical protein
MTPTPTLRISDKKFNKMIGNTSFGRERSASDRVAAVLLCETDTGLQWNQYTSLEALPANSGQVKFRPLTCVRKLSDEIYEANSPGKRVYRANIKRGVLIEGKPLLCFSPKKKPRCRHQKNQQSVNVNYPQCTVLSLDTRANTVIVSSSDMIVRAGQLRRPSQNQAKGGSAKKAVVEFAKQHKKTLSRSEREVFDEVANDFEWLHLIAFSLMPLSQDPQLPENLAAAPAKDNTRMMIMEMIARRFAKLSDVEVRLSPSFEVYQGTEVIHAIHYQLKVRWITTGREVNVTQHTAVAANNPVPKASDKALAVAVVLDTLNQQPYRSGPVLFPRPVPQTVSYAQAVVNGPVVPKGMQP